MSITYHNLHQDVLQSRYEKFADVTLIADVHFWGYVRSWDERQLQMSRFDFAFVGNGPK
jgi:hypothetical protein